MCLVPPFRCVARLARDTTSERTQRLVIQPTTTAMMEDETALVAAVGKDESAAEPHSVFPTTTESTDALGVGGGVGVLGGSTEDGIKVVDPEENLNHAVVAAPTTTNMAAPVANNTSKPDGTITARSNDADACSDLTDNNNDTEEQAPKSFPQKVSALSNCCVKCLVDVVGSLHGATVSATLC